MKRLESIDELRGISICAIVISHLGITGLPFSIQSVIDFCSNFVILLFMISSFLTFLSFEKCEINSINDYIKYIFHNVKKIYGLYFIALLISTFLGGNSYWLGNEYKISITNLISHILLIFGFVPHYSNSIIGIEWYIGTLFIFYLIAPLLKKIINNKNKSIFNFVFSMIISTVICHYLYIYTSDMMDSYIYANYYCKFCIIAMYPAISAGILAYYIYKEVNLDKSYSYLFFIVFIVLLVLYILGYSDLLLVNNISFLSIMFLFLIISLISINAKTGNKVFAFIGKKSLPIYLFHFMIINKISSMINNKNLLCYLFIFITAITASIAVGYLFDTIVNSCVKITKHE